MTPNISEFKENLHNLLCERKYDTILNTLQKTENDSFVLENVWNVIDTICIAVKTESLLKNDDDVTSCKKILMFLVSKCKPKEALIALLEHADSFKDHEFFCLLLDPLLYTLKKLPANRAKSLQWVLTTLNAHIKTLKLPEDLNLEGEEKLLLDADTAVQDAVYVLHHYLNFIEFFVDEVSFENLKMKEVCYTERVAKQQELLHRYILNLFYHPFLYQDLHLISESRPKSSMQSLSEKYIKCLSKICRNVFNLYKYDSLYNKKMKLKSSKTNEEEEEEENNDDVPSLALANLSYLLFVENMTLNFQPLVYSHLFLFMKNLKYITLLLESPRNLVIFKGLFLAETLLKGIEDSQVDYDCIELGAFSDFPKLLLNIAIHCKFEEHRKSAINLFQFYITKCNSKGRYHLIMQVMSTVKHSGAEGLVINLYKNYLHEALNGDESREYFLGKNFSLFLKKVFVLNEGVETDLLDNSDKIITALNFLRYLLLRDTKGNNATGIWDVVNFISENFLTPLTTGLDMSRAHYKQALKDAEDGVEQKRSVNTTVSVGGKILPNVPMHFQKDLYMKALTTFDVIESILCRVKELVSD